MENLIKFYWSKLIRMLSNERGEVENDGGAFSDAISKGLEEGEGREAAGGEGEGAKAPEIDIEGYKGDDRRAKAYDGEKRRSSDKVEEDPEHEVDFEMEEGKGKHKLKLSELKESSKWLFDNKGSIASHMKIRELATKHPEFGKLLNGVISKSFGENEAYNSEFVIKNLKALDEKASDVQGKIEDKGDEIKKAEELLNSNEIDPDSVQAQVLKSNIAAMKAQRNQLKEALGKIDEVSKKFGDVEKGQKEFITKHENAEQAVEVKRISDVFNKTFGALTEKDSKNGYKFVDNDEAQDFERRVRNMVSEGAKEIKDDESFVKLIHDSAKAVYERTGKLREAAVNDYLRRKGQSPAGSEGEGKSADADLETMQKQLSALERDGKAETPEAEKLRTAIKSKKDELEDPLKGKSIGETIADAMFAEA